MQRVISAHRRFNHGACEGATENAEEKGAQMLSDLYDDADNFA